MALDVESLGSDLSSLTTEHGHTLLTLQSVQVGQQRNANDIASEAAVARTNTLAVRDDVFAPSGPVAKLEAALKEQELSRQELAVRMGAQIFPDKASCAAFAQLASGGGTGKNIASCVPNFATLFMLVGAEPEDIKEALKQEEQAIKSQHEDVHSATVYASQQVRYPTVLDIKLDSLRTPAQITKEPISGTLKLQLGWSAGGLGSTDLKESILSSISSLKAVYRSHIEDKFGAETPYYHVCITALDEAVHHVNMWVAFVDKGHADLHKLCGCPKKAWMIMACFNLALFDRLWDLRSDGRGTKAQGAILWSSLQVH